jgi:cation-transporting ATPase 13A3/4/5
LLRRWRRQELERDLTFVGLLLLENKLKPETPHVIHELRNALINVVMITGTPQSVHKTHSKEYKHKVH